MRKGRRRAGEKKEMEENVDQTKVLPLLLTAQREKGMSADDGR